MRVLLVLVLVLLVLLTGLPLAMAGAHDCPSCLSDGVPGGLMACLAILVLFALILPTATGLTRPRRQFVPVLFLADRLDRPPRG